MEKLFQYIKHERNRDDFPLQSTTKFVTLRIMNYSTMASHNDLIIALENFIRKHTIVPMLENISLSKLSQLIDLFLHSNRFYYNHKIYTFLKGAPMNFPLTELLHHVYAYEWEQIIVEQSIMRGEFYGR